MVLHLPDSFVLTSSLDEVLRSHPSIAAVAGWLVGILSYHQDARFRLRGWAVVSQTLSVICLIALLAFGLAHEQWTNFLIVPALGWLQFQFTKRWWAKPGAWW
jgi:hypothetical protein